MLVILVDGACRPNPGMMGYAAVLLRDGEILAEVAESCSEKGTNNTSEMLAITLALTTAQGHVKPEEGITIVSDSNLAIGLLSKSHKTKLPHLARLRHDIRRIEKALGVAVTYEKGGDDDELFQLVDALSKEAVPLSPEEIATNALVEKVMANTIPQGYKEKETDE